jgi:predicted nucleic acid-binding protein
LRLALDTKVLAYVEGVNGESRQRPAIDLVQGLVKSETVVPAQALGELYNVLVRKSGWSGDRARAAITTSRDAFPLAPTTAAAVIAATDLAADQRLGIWGSLMLTVAAEGSCRLLLPEDLQEGFLWRGQPLCCGPASAACSDTEREQPIVTTPRSATGLPISSGL